MQCDFVNYACVASIFRDYERENYLKFNPSISHAWSMTIILEISKKRISYKFHSRFSDQFSIDIDTSGIITFLGYFRKNYIPIKRKSWCNLHLGEILNILNQIKKPFVVFPSSKNKRDLANFFFFLFFVPRNMHYHSTGIIYSIVTYYFTYPIHISFQK